MAQSASSCDITSVSSASVTIAIAMSAFVLADDSSEAVALPLHRQNTRSRIG